MEMINTFKKVAVEDLISEFEVQRILKDLIKKVREEFWPFYRSSLERAEKIFKFYEETRYKPFTVDALYFDFILPRLEVPRWVLEYMRKQVVDIVTNKLIREKQNELEKKFKKFFWVDKVYSYRDKFVITIMGKSFTELKESLDKLKGFLELFEDSKALIIEEEPDVKRALRRLEKIDNTLEDLRKSILGLLGRCEQVIEDYEKVKGLINETTQGISNSLKSGIFWKGQIIDYYLKYKKQAPPKIVEAIQKLRFLLKDID